MTIKELREAAGMSRKEFAEYFRISYRRVQNWELDTRGCSPLLLDLMAYKLEKEGVLKPQEERNVEEDLSTYRVYFNGNDETEVDAACEDEAVELAKQIAAESGLGFKLDEVECIG
jgi:transcriptional regulator with XRE-family HTH domain